MMLGTLDTWLTSNLYQGTSKPAYIIDCQILGGTRVVNDMKIFPYNSKGIPLQISTKGRYVSNNEQNLVIAVYERPPTTIFLIILSDY
jgi:hypothetical protein